MYVVQPHHMDTSATFSKHSKMILVRNYDNDQSYEHPRATKLFDVCDSDMVDLSELCSTDSIMYQYFVKIVPTAYVKIDGQVGVSLCLNASLCVVSSVCCLFFVHIGTVEMMSLHDLNQCANCSQQRHTGCRTLLWENYPVVSWLCLS